MQNNLIVKEPEEMILMTGGQFSESALKLSAYLIANLKENQNIYEINIKKYFERFDKKIEDYNYLKNIAEELFSKKFLMENRFDKRFEFYHLVSAVKYNDGILTIEFSKLLMEYLLKIKNKYLKYNIKNIISLNSKYSIKLYKMLKDKFKQQSRYNQETILKISIEDLRNFLEISSSYNYAMLKKRILEKAKKELSEKTDIYFDYEEIKKGRKVTDIRFFIYKNPKNYKEETSNKNKEIEAPKETKSTNKWNNWRKELLEKGNLIIIFNNEIFEVKNNYLFKDKKLLSSEKSFEIWQRLYENRDKLKMMSEDEYLQEQISRVEEQENKYKKLDEIKEKYENRNIFAQLNQSMPIAEYTPYAIQIGDNEKIEVYFEDNYSKERSKMLFSSVEDLEKFLERTRNAYLEVEKLKRKKQENSDREREMVDMTFEMPEILYKELEKFEEFNIPKEEILSILINIVSLKFVDKKTPVEIKEYFNQKILKRINKKDKK